MNIMSRSFTTKEKFLLAFLVFVLIGLAYYYFVDAPVRQSIASSEAEIRDLRDDITTAQSRLSYLKELKENIEAVAEEENLGWMGSYNNSKEEIRFLNDILSGTEKYVISFANVTRDGDQIRRSFTLQMQTNGYDEAREILTKLMQGKNRCLIGDMKCSVGKEGGVSISATATFYETMVGGVADAGLPEDKAKTKK